MDSIKDATTDDTFGLKGVVVTPGNKVQELAVSIMSRAVDLSTFSEMLFDEMLKVVEISTSKTTGREHQCSLLHLLTLNSNIRETWRKTITKTGISCELCCIDMLYSFIIKKAFLKCLYWKRETKQVGLEEDDINLNLSPHEAKVLRYVAGFLPFSIKSLYETRNDATSKVIVSILNSWRLSNDADKREQTYLEFSNAWVDRIDRGGLFLVNDDFYVFVKRVEDVARKVFNKKLINSYQGEDLRDTLMKRFEASPIVDSTWATLTRHVEDEKAKSILKEIILRKWIDIRARAFANAWIQKLKLMSFKTGKGPSKKAEPALRKTLNK